MTGESAPAETGIYTLGTPERAGTQMLLACSLAALVLAGGPAGERHLETTVQDDSLLLHSPPALVAEVARRIAWLGADRVRITAGWSALAPDPLSRRHPGLPFQTTDSATYPREGWLRVDRAVKAATSAGLDVQLDIAFWAPRWAVQRTSRRDPDRPRWAPDATEFGRFAQAVARRYDGTFPDPERPGARLPAVRMYTTWNEPNNSTFLEPQWIRRRRRWQPESPHIYRAMHEAAYDAIKGVSIQNVVLIGGTASTGSSRPGRGGVPPLRFLREMACVDDRMRPLAIPECNGYQPLPLYDTEYGYETNPPDPFAPFSPQQQAQFMGWSTYMAWRDPETRMFAQFPLQDQPPGVGEAGRPLPLRPARGRRGPRMSPQAEARRAWSGVQSGLFFPDGAPKPAVQAFRLPFWAESAVVAGQPVVRLFGGVRPGPGHQTVHVERQDAAGGPWTSIQVTGQSCDGATDFTTDDAGWFFRAAPYTGPANYRLSRQQPDGTWESGVEIPVSAPSEQAAGSRLPIGPTGG